MTLAGAPAISVVIVTLDRAEVLAATLESLDAQMSAPDHEVVVVDRGSTDPTPGICLARAATGRLRYRRIARVNGALAKNAGLLAARAPLVLFLDDDVIAPDLLAQHVRSHETHPDEAIAVQGPAAGSDRQVEDGGLRGGQWSCKRRFLLDHGVFDLSAPAALAEVELAGRLAEHGFRVVELAAAVTDAAAPGQPVPSRPA